MVVFKSRNSCAHLSGSGSVSATRVLASSSAQIFRFPSGSFRRKVGRSFLACCWIGGLICGICFCLNAGMSLFSWMRDGLLGPVSIRPMLCVTLLPFFLAAVAVFASGSGLLFGLAFAKGFSMACVGLAVQLLWADGGLLMRWLLLFASIHTAPLLYGFCLRHVGRDCPPSFAEIAWLLTAGCSLGSIDYFIIVPFLARLIHS